MYKLGIIFKLYSKSVLEVENVFNVVFRFWKPLQFERPETFVLNCFVFYCVCSNAKTVSSFETLKVAF